VGEQRVLAIMYHYVRDRAGTAEAGIRGLDTAAFTRQLDLLARHLEPISWPMLYAWSCGRMRIPERCFLLTFDDGLADHAEVVAPLLERRGLRGVFFASGHALEARGMDAAHQVHLLLATLGDVAFHDALRAWLDEHGPLDVGLGEVDREAAGRLYHYEPPDRALVKYFLHRVLPTDTRDRAVEELFRRHVGEPGEVARRWYLDCEQLVRLETAGHTVGGHGFAHCPYVPMPFQDRVRDLYRSAGLLRSVLGPGLRPFSYPYGSFDRVTALACADAGFAQAFTTRRGWIRGDDPSHELNRVDTIAVEAFLEQELLCPQS